MGLSCHVTGKKGLWPCEYVQLVDEGNILGFMPHPIIYLLQTQILSSYQFSVQCSSEARALDMPIVQLHFRVKVQSLRIVVIA